MHADQRRWDAPSSASGQSLFSYLRLSAFICGSILICSGCIPKKTNPTTHPIAIEEKRPATVEEAMKLIDHRVDWDELPAVNVPHYPAEQFLKGLTICIDPGHGGSDG